MTDDEAFIAAIRANPRDDTFRLVYADWLDERSDPRGEWLRIEVRLREAATDGRVYMPLVNRQGQLESDAEIDPSWQMAVRRQPSWAGAEIRNWRDLYDSLLIEPGGWEATVPKPTDVEFGQYEAATGFRLPRSYREYIQVFGPGQLLTDWDIAAPSCGGRWCHDLQTIHENLWPGDRYFGPRTEEHRERLLRLRYFCSKYKDSFGWDPTEVTDPAAPEYAVYRFIEDGQVVRVADSFRGFVEDALLEMLTNPHWHEEELGSPLRFELATRPIDPGVVRDVL